MKKKTLIQLAIESLNRRAGQYRRYSKSGWSGKADICQGAAERLEKENDKSKKDNS